MEKTLKKIAARAKIRARVLAAAKRRAQQPEKSGNGKKVITYADLDESQVVVYEGIHKWWRVMQECGGIAPPLTVGGYSGTGKSTLLSIALPSLLNPDNSKVRTLYAAFAGKAAVVLRNKGLVANTIHSTIYNCIADKDSPGRFMFILKDRHDIEADLLVIDEASMVPEDLRNDLESLNIPLLYTGDHGQLPPVSGKGNVMENPRFRLEKIHRQAKDSGIIEIATIIRQGGIEQPDGKIKPFMLKKGTYGVNKDAEVLSSRAANDTGFLASADVVICFTNNMRQTLNHRIREEKGFTGKSPQVGERLICVANNKENQMFNGLMVFVRDVYVEDDLMTLDLVDEAGKVYENIIASKNYFEGLPLDRFQMSDKETCHFEFGYAITGHKSQGSQWPFVIVIEEKMSVLSMDMKKRWKYTTLTRAESKVKLISKFA